VEEDKKQEKKDDVTMPSEAVLVPIAPITPNNECRALVLIPSTEQPQITEIVPLNKPKANKPKRKPSPASYAKLRQLAKERGKETKRRILAVLLGWATQTKYPGVVGGAIINIVDSLGFAGYKLSERTVRGHVLELAKTNELYCERMVYDPKYTYKPRKKKLPTGHNYEYYVALAGNHDERGLHEVVYHGMPYSYIDKRDSKGRFSKGDK
jgi:hypothetical protein